MSRYSKRAPTKCTHGPHASTHSARITLGWKEADGAAELRRKNRADGCGDRLLLVPGMALRLPRGSVSTTMSSWSRFHVMAIYHPLSFDGVHRFLDTLFGDDLHA